MKEDKMALEECRHGKNVGVDQTKMKHLSSIEKVLMLNEWFQVS